jgi:ferredoxin
VTTIEVDRTRCEGHGLCENAAPSIYRVGEDGQVEILVSEIVPELLDRAEAGARLCPVNALRVVGG